MSALKTCLIISPYFPPSTLAGVHRARHLAKHLPAAGWKPIILCVDEKYHEQRLDPGLASLVPPSVEVVKVSALPAGSCRAIGLGEISLRAWQPLRRAAMHLLATRSVGVVMITGSPFYPMLLSSEIKRRFNVPVILDFQDPWVSHWGATQPRWSKVGIVHLLAKILEPRALRAADFLTSVSKTQNAQMIARYPWLNGERMSAIPIGGDPEDYTALRSHYVSDDSPVKWPPGQRTLAFVGTVMPRTAPVMEQVLKGFGMARSQNPAVMETVRLLFVGTSNQPDDTTTFRILPLARAVGLASGVEEIPQRVPFLDAIAVLARSEGILLIGSDEPHYTASKIYPGLMSGRPYLSVFHRTSSAHSILSQAGGGIAVAFDGKDELHALPGKIAEALVRLVIDPKQLGRAKTSAYEACTAQAIAQSYARIFDGLALGR